MPMNNQIKFAFVGLILVIVDLRKVTNLSLSHVSLPFRRIVVLYFTFLDEITTRNVHII